MPEGWILRSKHHCESLPFKCVGVYAHAWIQLTVPLSWLQLVYMFTIKYHSNFPPYVNSRAPAFTVKDHNNGTLDILLRVLWPYFG